MLLALIYTYDVIQELSAPYPLAAQESRGKNRFHHNRVKYEIKR